MDIHTCVYIHIHVYVYIHIYIHAYMYMYVQSILYRVVFEGPNVLGVQHQVLVSTLLSAEVDEGILISGCMPPPGPAPDSRKQLSHKSGNVNATCVIASMLPEVTCVVPYPESQVAQNNRPRYHSVARNYLKVARNSGPLAFQVKARHCSTGPSWDPRFGILG